MSVTVAELIQELSAFDPTLRVCVSGYEGGYKDVRKDRIWVRRISLNVNDEWWYGPHDEGEEETAIVIC